MDFIFLKRRQIGATYYAESMLKQLNAFNEYQKNIKNKLREKKLKRILNGKEAIN